MLDLSGVLQVPDSGWVREQLANLRFTCAEPAIRRAHYRAIRAFDRSPPADHRAAYIAAYPDGFLDALSVPSRLRVSARIALFDGGVNVVRQTIDVTSVGVVRALTARADVVVVTNTARAGVARARLADVGLVTRDQCGPLAAVVDSAEIGIAKPDPAILRFALAAAGRSDHDSRRVVFVGDSLRLDGQAARLVGIAFRHYDPFRECPEAAHGHLQCLPDLFHL